jgi:hypothetical protein
MAMGYGVSYMQAATAEDVAGTANKRTANKFRYAKMVFEVATSIPIPGDDEPVLNLITHPNPYSAVWLAREPSLALLQSTSIVSCGGRGCSVRWVGLGVYEGVGLGVYEGER